MGEIIVWPKPLTPLPFTGERLTSDYGGQTQIEHLHRYLLAREWCRGKDVLDVASGEGYGTALLAQVARSAVGVEIAPDAVEHAAGSYVANNLRFVVGDARALPSSDTAFDVVTSFETIEHFAEHRRYLDEIRRVLRPGGLLIISTPDRDNYSPAETPANPYHVRELTATEFDTLLRSRFAEVSVLFQRPMFGSVLLPIGGSESPPLCYERRGNLHFEGSTNLSRPKYLIAFASDSPAITLPPSVYIDTGRLGMLSPPEAEAQLRLAQTALATERANKTEVAALEMEALRAELTLATERANKTEVAASEMEALRAELTLATERANKTGVAASEMEALRAELTLATERANKAEVAASEMEALRTDVATARREVKGLLAANEMAERACALQRDQLALQRDQLAEYPERMERMAVASRTLAGELEALLASTSWRVTAPLRTVSRALRRSRR